MFNLSRSDVHQFPSSESWSRSKPETKSAIMEFKKWLTKNKHRHQNIARELQTCNQSYLLYYWHTKRLWIYKGNKCQLKWSLKLITPRYRNFPKSGIMVHGSIYMDSHIFFWTARIPTYTGHIYFWTAWMPIYTSPSLYASNSFGQPPQYLFKHHTVSEKLFSESINLMRLLAIQVFSTSQCDEQVKL